MSAAAFPLQLQLMLRTSSQGSHQCCYLLAERGGGLLCMLHNPGINVTCHVKTGLKLDPIKYTRVLAWCPLIVFFLFNYYEMSLLLILQHPEKLCYEYMLLIYLFHVKMFLHEQKVSVSLTTRFLYYGTLLFIRLNCFFSLNLSWTVLLLSIM